MLVKPRNEWHGGRLFFHGEDDAPFATASAANLPHRSAELPAPPMTHIHR